MALCLLADVHSRLIVYVNPALVRAARPDPHGDGTILEFDNEHKVVVASAVEEVVKALNDADRT